MRRLFKKLKSRAIRHIKEKKTSSNSRGLTLLEQQRFEKQLKDKR